MTSKSAQSKQNEALLNDEDFVRRLREYDEKAYEILLSTLKDRIYNLAIRLTRNNEEAEEVVQETFLAIFNKIDTFQGKSRLTTWIYSIAYNAALNRLKKNSSRMVTFEDETNLNIDPSWLRNKSTSFELDSERPLLEKELQERLATAIDSLPEGYREIFILKEIEKMPVKEVAEIYGINPGAVKTRLHRARLILRARLSDYWEMDQNP